MRTTEAQEHTDLLDALRDYGHDVDEWADDPSMLRAYAEAIDFDAYADDSDYRYEMARDLS